MPQNSSRRAARSCKYRWLRPATNQSRTRRREFLVQDLLFERLEYPRFDLVTPEGDVAVARAFVASAEACQTVAASAVTRSPQPRGADQIIEILSPASIA